MAEPQKDMGMAAFERREQIKVLWAGGVRSFSKMATAVKCNVRTVKRDMVYLRRDANRYILRRNKIELIRLEEDTGLLSDIEQINVLIQNNKTNVDAVIGLIGKKLMARRQRAELHELIKTGSNIHVQANATAVAAINPVKNMKDEELEEVYGRHFKR